MEVQFVRFSVPPVAVMALPVMVLPVRLTSPPFTMMGVLVKFFAEVKVPPLVDTEESFMSTFTMTVLLLLIIAPFLSLPVTVPFTVSVLFLRISMAGPLLFVTEPAFGSAELSFSSITTVQPSSMTRAAELVLLPMTGL